MKRQLTTVSASAFLLALAATLPASATTGPGCYRVVNVPSWDVLNVRKWPSPRSAIVMALSSETYAIISARGACRAGWCPVNVTSEFGTKRGWIKARYLTSSECP
jgi:hypothetical protein